MASPKEMYCSYRGWVDKLGYRMPSWKRRFLVLDGVRGFYYTSPPEVAFSCVKGSFSLGHAPTGPAGTPALSVCSVVSDLIRHNIEKSSTMLPWLASGSTKRPNLVQVQNALDSDDKSRTFYFAFESDFEVEYFLAVVKCNLAIYCEMPSTRSAFLQGVRASLLKRAGSLRNSVDEIAARKCKEEFDVPEIVPPAAADGVSVFDSVWFKVHTIASKADKIRDLVHAHAVGHDIHVKNSEGGSTLCQAAAYGNLPAIVFLHLCGGDLNGVSHATGNTALHAAAINGRAHAVSLLLRLGADPAIVNKNGQSALDVSTTDACADLLRTPQSPSQVVHERPRSVSSSNTRPSSVYSASSLSPSMSERKKRVSFKLDTASASDSPSQPLPVSSPSPSTHVSSSSSSSSPSKHTLSSQKSLAQSSSQSLPPARPAPYSSSSSSSPLSPPPLSSSSLPSSKDQKRQEEDSGDYVE